MAESTIITVIVTVIDTIPIVSIMLLLSIILLPMILEMFSCMMFSLVANIFERYYYIACIYIYIVIYVLSIPACGIFQTFSKLSL